MADLLRRLPQPRQTLEVADASVGSFKAAAATETAIVAASRGPPPYGKRKGMFCCMEETEAKAAAAKAKGNAAFAAKDFTSAIKHFTEALTLASLE
eukprot:symbB.v1.2.013769.t1/scaffold983.1/size146703/4